MRQASRILACVALLAGWTVACSSSPEDLSKTGRGAGGATGGAGGATGGTGGATGGSGGDTGGSGGATGGVGGDIGGSGGAIGGSGGDTGGTGGDTGGTGGTGGTSVGGSGGSSTDPYAAARATCIAKINALRATKSLSAYNQWTSAEACVDGQATSDEQSSSPHGAFNQCGESAQNECLGSGASGIEGCLDSMWAEKDQPGCAGCDACADGYNPNCPNCDFYGSTTGDVCGHYVNMSAKYFSQAACGFSDLGGWAAIDFR